MRSFKSILLLMTIALSMACSPESTGNTSGQVTVDGTQFLHKGKPYRYIGTNMWYASVLA